jgi:hypothetical protein
MSQPDEMSVIAAEFRRHFDQYYLGVIPRLLNEEGVMLAFICLLTGIECLAGAFQPQKSTGDRFKEFITTFFSAPYHPIAGEMWQFRNLMIHAFNPSPFTIGCHQSKMHLLEIGVVWYLNVEDLYAEMVTSSRGYFTALYADLQLQANFSKRGTEKGGGRIVPIAFTESISPMDPLANQPFERTPS